ncbi:hypothetical protein DL96DRAFT_1709902 [Flagelloscypha sp. PMI_526]|nr:hypothetical protein DL96DRAFT_1709902 [Flagelloscypha sp. PMI_526]
MPLRRLVPAAPIPFANTAQDEITCPPLTSDTENSGCVKGRDKDAFASRLWKASALISIGQFGDRFLNGSIQLEGQPPTSLHTRGTHRSIHSPVNNLWNSHIGNGFAAQLGTLFLAMIIRHGVAIHEPTCDSTDASADNIFIKLEMHGLLTLNEHDLSRLRNANDSTAVSVFPDFRGVGTRLKEAFCCDHLCNLGVSRWMLFYFQRGRCTALPKSFQEKLGFRSSTTSMSEYDETDIWMMEEEAVAVRAAQRMNVGLAALIRPRLSPSPKSHEGRSLTSPIPSPRSSAFSKSSATPVREASHLSRIWEEPFDWRIPRCAWRRNECPKGSNLLYYLDGVDSSLSHP